MAEPAVSTIGSWESDNVTVGQVEKALTELRRHEQRAAVRTSVLTLVAVVRTDAEADGARQIIGELGARHPSRSLIIVALDDEPDGPNSTDAAVWVHAIEREGRAVCFEEVVLRVRGPARHHLFEWAPEQVFHDRAQGRIRDHRQQQAEKANGMA